MTWRLWVQSSLCIFELNSNMYVQNSFELKLNSARSSPIHNRLCPHHTKKSQSWPTSSPTLALCMPCTKIKDWEHKSMFLIRNRTRYGRLGVMGFEYIPGICFTWSVGKSRPGTSLVMWRGQLHGSSFITRSKCLCIG